MAVKNNAEKCCYCGGCVGCCPVMAIELKDIRIMIDNEKCTSCGNCVKICPVGAMEVLR